MSESTREKVVLAYSGGLDTSVIVKWLQVVKNMDVIAICGNVGQDEKDLSWIKQKALDMGAIASEAIDMREEYADTILAKAIWANGKYEGVYPLLSALSRPLISKHLVDIAHKYGAKYIAHGCARAHHQEEALLHRRQPVGPCHRVRRAGGHLEHASRRHLDDDQELGGLPQRARDHHHWF